MKVMEESKSKTKLSPRFVARMIINPKQKKVVYEVEGNPDLEAKLGIKKGPSRS